MKSADVIRSKRKAKGWTQSELAERMGVSNAAVGLWETGGGISLANLLQLRDLVGLEFSADPSASSPHGYGIVQDPEKLAWLTLFDIMDEAERLYVARMLRGSVKLRPGS